jgi:hypothetical protein
MSVRVCNSCQARNKRHSHEVFHQLASLQAVYDFAFAKSQGQMYMLSAVHSGCVQCLQHGVIAMNVHAGV